MLNKISRFLFGKKDEAKQPAKLKTEWIYAKPMVRLTGNLGIKKSL